MSSFQFATLDVFAERRFEGNQLAVFPDARGIPDALMPSIAREFRYSETAFVLPPEHGGDARVRIFTLDGEARFAGHPLVGTAVVLASRRGTEALRLEVPAGQAYVTVDTTGELPIATVTTPQPFELEQTVPVELVSAALSVPREDIISARHEPTACGMGRAFVVVEFEPEALAVAKPDHAAFETARRTLAASRFAVLAYARTGDGVAEARMFSPLTGTVEDAATGSANVALAGLLLSCEPTRHELSLTVRQGVRLGRPSTLRLRAWRQDEHVVASVAGAVVEVTSGSLTI